MTATKRPNSNLAHKRKMWVTVSPLNRHKRLAALLDPLGLGDFDPRLLPLPTMTDHTTGGWPTDHPSVREAVTHPILKTADPLAPRLL